MGICKQEPRRFPSVEDGIPTVWRIGEYRAE